MTQTTHAALRAGMAGIPLTMSALGEVDLSWRCGSSRHRQIIDFLFLSTRPQKSMFRNSSLKNGPGKIHKHLHICGQPLICHGSWTRAAVCGIELSRMLGGHADGEGGGVTRIKRFNVCSL